MTFDDFEEMSPEFIAELADHLLEKLKSDD